MKEGEMENRIKTLEDQVRTLQTLLDIEEIKKLQRAYGYYLEHWMGKASVKRYYEGRFKTEPELFHQLMQLCPVIDVSPDGKTAKGRWYGFGAVAAPHGKGVGQSIMNGIYENEYIKQDGKWKFKRIHWAMNYMMKPGPGLVAPERLAAADSEFKMTWPEPDIPPTRFDARYPSGYILPFHYKHPITGKITSEEKTNQSVKGIEKS
jgi:hypothetical protein